MPGRAKWFPAGTYAANTLACAVIFAAAAVLNVQRGYWGVVLLTGVQSGFCGALSTVSTLVNEVSARPAC